MRSCFGLVLVPVLLCCACGQKPASQQRPTKLRFAYNPSADDIQSSPERYRLLHDYLSHTLNMPVDLVHVTGYGATIEALRSNKLDAGTMGPVAYLIAASKGDVEPLVVPGRASGPNTYRSCIIVRNDSPVRTLEDLLRDSQKYTFAFVDPASASGHLIPRVFLEGRGMDPNKAFRKTFFSNSHPASLYTVTGGKVDAAATMASMIQVMEDNGKLRRGEVRILWESPDIPQSPVIARKALPAAFKEEIRQAFLNMDKANPALAKAMQITTNYADFRYHPANDAMYDGLRQMAKDVKSIRILE